MMNLYLCKCLLAKTSPNQCYKVYVAAESPEEALRKLKDDDGDNELFEMTLIASDTLFIPGTSDDPSVIV